MRRNRLGKERFARGAATTSSPGLFPFKMAGHVSGANIPGNVVFATRCFFPPIPFSKGKHSRRGWSCEAVRRMECFLRPAMPAG